MAVAVAVAVSVENNFSNHLAASVSSESGDLENQLKLGDGCHKVVTQIETERLDLELVLRAGLPLVCHVMALACHHHHNPSNLETDLISSNYIGLTDIRH